MALRLSQGTRTVVEAVSRNTAQWARNSMVKEGLMASDSPRGIWEITDEGEQWLEAQMKQE